MATKLMTADDALAGMGAKLQAKALPPGLIPAILEAVIGLFKSFCPTMAAEPGTMKATAKAGLQASKAGEFTIQRFHLRRALRRHMGFFSRNVDEAESALWEIAAETPDDEISRYAAVWQAHRDTITTSDD